MCGFGVIERFIRRLEIAVVIPSRNNNKRYIDIMYVISRQIINLIVVKPTWW